MTDIEVGKDDTVPLPIAVDQPVVLQNIGPGIVYVDGDPAVATTSGVKLPVSDALVLIPTPEHVGTLYLISDTASTHVRYIS